MSETFCINCETLIERVGPTLWVHKPKPLSYKVACPGLWGYVATPAEVTE